MDLNPLSNSIEVLGLEKCLCFLEDVFSKLKPNATILDVGSGNGYLTKLIYDKFKIRVIKIDPFPNKFLPREGNIKSDFKTVSDFMKSKYYIKENEILIILNHPEPEGYSEFSGTGSVRYDIDSINLLNPTKIVLFTELSGSCGSSELNFKLRRLIGDKLDLSKSTYAILSDIQYKGNTSDFNYKLINIIGENIDGGKFVGQKNYAGIYLELI
jgi:hypothetical protein